MGEIVDRIVADDMVVDDVDGARLKDIADRMNERRSFVDAKGRVCWKWTQEEREILWRCLCYVRWKRLRERFMRDVQSGYKLRTTHLCVERSKHALRNQLQVTERGGLTKMKRNKMRLNRRWIVKFVRYLKYLVIVTRKR